MKSPVTYRGVTYPSLYALANSGLTHLNYTTIKRRMRSGMSLEEALEPNPPKRYMTKRRWEYRGMYLTIDELEKYSDTVDTATLVKRLYDGWDAEKALHTPVFYQSMQKRLWMYEGKEMRVEELAKIATNGLSSVQIYRRLLNGWSVENAITLDMYVRRPSLKSRQNARESEEVRTAKWWILKYILSSFDSPYGTPIEQPRQTGARRVEFERLYYKWIFDFHGLGAKCFTVTSIFRNTEEISWPKHLYSLTESGFREIARYDMNGQDLLAYAKPLVRLK